MADKISIKAINSELIWNQSIGSLMNYFCYRIGFEYKTIRMYVDQGELSDGISFQQAEAGVYDLDSINSEYFNKLHFSLATPEALFTNYITGINTEIYDLRTSPRKTLDLFYIGKNIASPSNIQVFSESIEPNFDTFKNWSFTIQQIRQYLRNEDHGTVYDWRNRVRIIRKGLQFKELTVFGITSSSFNGSFNSETNQLEHLRLERVRDLSEYYQYRDTISSSTTFPSLSDTPKYLESIQHLKLKDIWEINGLVVEMKSTYIYDSSHMKYALYIYPQDVYWKYNKRS